MFFSVVSITAFCPVYSKYTVAGNFQRAQTPHGVHLVELAYDHAPTAHVWQVAREVAALTLEYVPARHVVQSDAPMVE
jgi:hypothetical protein